MTSTRSSMRTLLLAALVLLIEFPVRKFRHRVLIKELHVGVRGRTVEVVIIFLYVLAMISLWSGKAEKAFFKDLVFFVP